MRVRSLTLLIGLASLGVSAYAVGPAAIPFQTGFPFKLMVGRVDFVSPASVDLNGDGRLELVAADSRGCVFAWDRAGQLLAGFPAASNLPCGDVNAGRILNALALGDLTGDGRPEIVGGSRAAGGQPARVTVWNAQGGVVWRLEGLHWSASVGVPEVMSVALANVAGDAALEVIAGTNNQTDSEAATAYNLYAISAAGQVLPGFPTGYRSAGIFGSVGAADLTGDGRPEMVVGRDQLYLHAYSAEGSPLAGWPVRSYLDPARTTWGQDRYVEFTHSAPAIGDLNRDGVPEVIIAGKVRDPQAGSGDPVVANTLLVTRPDGQRQSCWQTLPLTSAPLDGNFAPSQAPALGDLDGDGVLEIVVVDGDGRVRAYTSGGRLRWTYDFAQGRRRFGSEPVLGDVTGDGSVDVVFGTYSPDSPEASSTGIGIYALNAQGQLHPGFPLALTLDTGSARGVRAAPTLTDLDGDGDVEIIAASFSGALYVWDLPGAYRADRMPWPTGRQNNQRTGAAPAAAASAPTGSALPPAGPNRLYLPAVHNTGCN